LPSSNQSHGDFTAGSRIRGGQLAWLALECGIWRELDALAEAADVRPAAVLDARQRFEHARHELHRAREIIIVEHRVEDVRDDAVGRRIRRKAGIEARFRDLHFDPQRLRGVGGMERPCNGGENPQAIRRDTRGAGCRSIHVVGPLSDQGERS
jgi:hypothetical protein